MRISKMPILSRLLLGAHGLGHRDCCVLAILRCPRLRVLLVCRCLLLVHHFTKRLQATVASEPDQTYIRGMLCCLGDLWYHSWIIPTGHNDKLRWEATSNRSRNHDFNSTTIWRRDYDENVERDCSVAPKANEQTIAAKWRIGRLDF